MKQAVVILLICIYALSSFGFGYKEFYCCGKLKSAGVTLAVAGKDKCDMSTAEDGCCETKYLFFKVKDKHFASGESTVPVKHFTNYIYLAPSYQNISFVAQPANIINGSHAPPLYKEIPIYISNCVFII